MAYFNCYGAEKVTLKQVFLTFCYVVPLKWDGKWKNTPFFKGKGNAFFGHGCIASHVASDPPPPPPPPVAMTSSTHSFAYIHISTVQDRFWWKLRKFIIPYLPYILSDLYKIFTVLFEIICSLYWLNFNLDRIFPLRCWRLVTSILGLGSMGNVCYSKIKSSSTG